MSKSQDETPEDLGFQKLSLNDILKERGQSSNGHSRDSVPVGGPAKPVCAVCRDTRWLASSPLVPGRAPVLVRCICQKTNRDQANRLETYADLGNLSDRTFKTLRPRWRRGTADPDSMENGVRIAKEFANDPSGWLVITGPVRTGKSHLAAAITNQCKSRGKPAKFVSAMHIADIAMSLDRWSDGEDAEVKWDALINAPILVVDDFGAQHSNARVEARLDQLLTVRATGQTPTVVVLARPCQELPDRFAQRLSDEQLCNWIEILPRGRPEVSAGQVPRRMLERMTFGTFDPSGSPFAEPNQRESLSLAFKSAKEFAKEPKKWLHFHGEIGAGKTHLAVAIAGHAATLGYVPTFWRLADLLDKLRDSFSERSQESFYEVFESVKNSELLILDDFGPPKMSDWTLEKLYQLVCHRYDRLLPTVTASQYVVWRPGFKWGFYERQEIDFRDVQDKLLWEMIMSRIRDSSVVTERLMTAPDYRNRGA